MKYMKQIAAVLMVLILVLSLCACGSKKEETITLRYGSADAEDAAVVQGLLAFKEYVEKESNGSIQVQTYINGVLGGDRELCEGLQIDTVDMCVVMGSILANYDSAFNIFGLPYLWNDKQASYDAADGEFGTVMAERAEKIGFKLLGYGDGGAYHIGTNNKAIETMADMKGQKIRVPEVDVDINYFSAIGATPTPISFAEAYAALEQGVVTGIELPIELMYCSQYFDALESITLTGHFQCLFPVLISPAAWNRMSEEQQAIVMKGIEKQVEVNRKMAADAESKYLEIFKESGKPVCELSDGEMANFVAVGQQIQKQYEQSIGQDLIQLAQSYN